MGEYYGVRRADDDQHLEHWGVPKGWTKQGHKYIARLVSNTGKGYRYIYTQAELAAAKAGKLANKAGKAVANATGLTARNRAQATARRADRYTHPTRKGQEHPDGRAARMARSTAKRAQAAYDKTLLGRAENMFNSARKAVGDAASEAGKQANKTYKAARKGVMNAGKQISRTANDAWDNVQRTANNTYKTARKGVMNAAGDAQKYVNKQVGRAQKAYKDYQNFKNLPDWQKQIAVNADRKGVKKVMGRNVRGAAMASRLEGIENAIRGAASSVSRGANNAYRGARKGVMDAGKQISRTANDAWDNVQRTANDVYRGARKTVRDADRNVRSQTKRAIRSTSVGMDIDDRIGLTKQGRHNRRNERYKQEVLANREYNRHDANFSKKRKASYRRKGKSNHSRGSF